MDITHDIRKRKCRCALCRALKTLVEPPTEKEKRKRTVKGYGKTLTGG